MISLIVCVGQNNEIGRNGDLCWRIKEDMEFFRKTTLGHKVIMGFNTFKSLEFKPLKGRQNIVVSRELLDNANIECVMESDLQDKLREWKASSEEMMVIGGAKLYNQALPYADRVYLTKVQREDEDADRFFPVMDFSWKEKDRRVLADGVSLHIYEKKDKILKSRLEALQRPYVNEKPFFTHYRLWDSKKQTWYGFGDKNTLAYYGFDPFCGEVVLNQKWPLNWHEYDFVQVMQSSGVADRFGVEIYQGDIILCEEEEDELHGLFEVIFEDARFVLKPLNEECFRKDFYDYNDPEQDWVVVGHIFQSDRKYFCDNCLTLFETGKYGEEDLDIYDDVCPRCGCADCEQIAS